MPVLQAILPQHFLSRVVGWFARLEQPVWLKNRLIRLFMARYGIDLTRRRAAMQRIIQASMRFSPAHCARECDHWGTPTGVILRMVS